mmetsp:Transcript_8268/g.8104  ORF Transcript_8268/g.8104 Transcript_8268/m.8104 type:complete len:150 (-) Transcript_8268:8-457(-)
MTLSVAEYASKSDSELFQAIKTQKWPEVEKLLRDEPNLTTIDDEFGNLPLHSAIGFKCPDDIVIKILAANPNACQVHGTDDWLPLHIAAMWGASTEIMTALIRTYPDGLDDSGQSNNKGRSPRHFSTRFEHNRTLLERSTKDWKNELEK